MIHRRRFLAGVAGVPVALVPSESRGASRDGDARSFEGVTDGESVDGAGGRSATAAGDWRQRQRIVPEDGDAGDGFGRSLALSADATTALVGAIRDDEPNGSGAGAAYVYERASPADEWRFEEKLAAADGDADDGFGIAAELSDDGETALIGALADEDPNGDGAGSAYVFERTGGGSWRQRAKLAADDGDGGDAFGYELSLSGDGETALIGARFDEDPNGDGAGSAYAYRLIDDEWDQRAKLVADDGTTDDRFGFEVSLSRDGDRALVGALSAGDGDPGPGAAYVFDWIDGFAGWEQRAKLTAPDGEANDNFGNGVTLSADGATAVVGAPKDSDPNGPEAGSAHVFAHIGDAWTHRTKLVARDGGPNESFGVRTVLSDDGGTALIGALGIGDTEDPPEGAAYAFERDGGDWSQRARLTAADGVEGNRFGSPELSGDGTVALVGSWYADTRHGQEAGAAYAFRRGDLDVADVRITDVTVDPGTVDAGGTVEATATVANEGTAEGSAALRVRLDGDLRGSETVTLAPGAAQTVAFEVALDVDPGEYALTVARADGGDAVERAITVEESPLQQLQAAHLETAREAGESSITSLYVVDYARTANEEYAAAVEDGRLTEQEAFDALQRLDAGVETTATVLDYIGPDPELGGEDRVNLSKEMALPTLRTAITLATAGAGAAQKAASSGGGLLSTVASTAKDKAIEAGKAVLKSAFGRAANVAGRVEVESSQLVEDLLNGALDTAAAIQSRIDAVVDTVAELVAGRLRTFAEQGVVAPPVGLQGTLIGDSPAALDAGIDVLYDLLGADRVADVGLDGTNDGALSAATAASQDIQGQADSSQETIREVESFVGQYDIAGTLYELVTDPDLWAAVDTVVSLALTLGGSVVDAFSTGVGIGGLIGVNAAHHAGLAGILRGEPL